MLLTTGSVEGAIRGAADNVVGSVCVCVFFFPFASSLSLSSSFSS